MSISYLKEWYVRRTLTPVRGQLGLSQTLVALADVRPAVLVDCYTGDVWSSIFWVIDESQPVGATNRRGIVESLAYFASNSRCLVQNDRPTMRHEINLVLLQPRQHMQQR